ncbi:hypothetical protein KCU77_g45, partial [Aureobasidium melanogenum]
MVLESFEECVIERRRMEKARINPEMGEVGVAGGLQSSRVTLAEGRDGGAQSSSISVNFEGGMEYAKEEQKKRRRDQQDHLYHPICTTRHATGSSHPCRHNGHGGPLENLKFGSRYP